MPVEIKSATLHTLRLVLRQANTPAILGALDQRMRAAGSFFQNEPVVIDAHGLDAPIDWAAVTRALRAHHMPPIGVIAQGENLSAARAVGLVPVELGAAPVRPQAVAEDAAAAAPSAASPPPPPAEALPAVAPAAMMVRRPLRSGQRIYARNTDLIVIGMVAHGAEVIADGNIHVYGPLRGRAMAGARGDQSACIFAAQLDAELLAIAGVYRVLETQLDPRLHNRACVVQLHEDKIDIQAL